MWWPGTELNRRRQPFQGCALPPELPGHAFALWSETPCDAHMLERRFPNQGSQGTESAWNRPDYSNATEIAQSGDRSRCRSSALDLAVGRTFQPAVLFVPFITTNAQRFEANQYGIWRYSQTSKTERSASFPASIELFRCC